MIMWKTLGTLSIALGLVAIGGSASADRTAIASYLLGESDLSAFEPRRART